MIQRHGDYLSVCVGIKNNTAQVVDVQFRRPCCGVPRAANTKRLRRFSPLSVTLRTVPIAKHCAGMR